MNRRELLSALPTLALPTTNKPKPPTCPPPPCTPSIPTIKSVHFDDQIQIWGSFLPHLSPDDIVTTIPGQRYNDEIVYYRKYDAIVYIDYNHSSGKPHVIIFKRGGEIPRAWDRIQAIAPGILSYWGNNLNGGLYHCLVDFPRTLDNARTKGLIYMDWTPLEQFRTNGSIPPLDSQDR